jgi:hypothetical protein
MAKDSAFISTLKDGDFPLRPSQSYKLKDLIAMTSGKGDFRTVTGLIPAFSKAGYSPYL